MDNGSVIVITNNKNTGKSSNVRIGDSSPSKYPIFCFFAKIASSRNETEWKDFFDIMSKGKFFKEFKFDNNFLIYKTKNKKKMASIELAFEGNLNTGTFTEHNINLYNDCRNFIMAHSTYFIQNNTDGINSSDKQNNTDVNVAEKQNISLGMSVPKQSYKIKEYVSRYGKLFNLTKRDQEHLVSLIFEHFSSKRLTSKSFHMLNENMIDHIDHLVFTRGGYYFENLPPVKIRKATTKEDEPTKIVLKCSKHLHMIY